MTTRPPASAAAHAEESRRPAEAGRSPARGGPASILVTLEQGPLSSRPHGPDAAPATAGAETAFIGRTRLEVDPRRGRLVRLDYDAHPVLAERTLERIAREVARDHDAAAILIRHALGSVAIGEASLEVVVFTAHRREGFDACRTVVDRLKREVPIWKAEHWEDGSVTRPAGTRIVSAAPRSPRPPEPAP